MTSFVCRTLKCFPHQMLNYSKLQLLRHSPVLLLQRPKSSESNLSPAETAARTNWKCRQDLATAFRGLDFYGMGEGVCTHLTMIAPALNGNGDVMLMIPHGLHWSQVCSNLVHLCEMLVCVTGALIVWDTWRLQTSGVYAVLWNNSDDNDQGGENKENSTIKSWGCFNKMMPELQGDYF